MKRPLLRWLAPVAAAVVFAAGGTVVSAIGSAARADLPARSAATLLTDIAHARLHGVSGTVSESADLGLPALPASMAGEGSSADFSSLISGTHTMRVWYAAPGRTRIALLGDGSESDLVADGSSLWLWSSADHAVTRYRLPTDGPSSAGDGTDPSPRPGTMPTTPQQLADMALAAITPSTTVTTNGSAEVAGRQAYLLTISPRTSDTLVDSVQIAIDSATHVPTRVQVYAVDHTDPVLSLGFTRFDPTTPDASRFAFTPPPGATVTEKTLPSESGQHAGSATGHSAHSADGPRPQVVGSDWSSVVVLPAGAGQQLFAAQAGRTASGQTGSGSTGSDQGGSTGSAGQLGALLRQLTPVSGAWGSGRLLRGTLVSVVVADDGRVAFGAVPPASLYDALQHTAAPAAE
ncbi:MAG: LolA family protein [Marmoricola sp.]